MGINIDANVAKTDPMKAVQKVELSFGTWEVMAYWGYMSKDIFWTGILLNSFPKTAGDIREKLIFETNKYIRQAELEGRDMNSGDMPIYDHLREYIKTIQDSQELTGRKADGGDDTRSAAKTIYQKPRYHQGGLESAAAASIASSLSVTSDTKFSGEVDRAAGVMTYSEDGRRRIYTATRVQCAECLRGRTATEKSTHAPQCFLGMCTTCNNYGHKWSDCKQIPTSFRQGKKQADEENSAEKK